ncbi:SPFH domain-containing protein [Romboutsia sp.]|uniref:SPFH domain-containing protein n=1 Tax=Romboutsia sp. TaxID=1965302 RepID=UPI003F3A640C
MENNMSKYEEREPKVLNGMMAIILIFVWIVISIGMIIAGGFLQSAILIFLGILFNVVSFISFGGLKIVNPQEALVLVLFGKYYGTIKREGFYWVNPFSFAVNPTYGSAIAPSKKSQEDVNITYHANNKKISLKTMTLNNEKQKVNDQLGNPIIIGVVAIWKVVDPTKAVFNVENYKTFISIQCDTTIRNIARLYPYDVSEHGDEKSLRGSSQEIADRLRTELQSRVEIAGIEVTEVRITHLSYAPEIAAAMLQRQQAEAIIAARKKIVEGAVSMVEMALNNLKENDVVNLTEERKASMVSNLLVVLCANKDTQPIVNSGFDE